MAKALSRIGINTYAIFLSFLAGMATGMWSAVGVVLFAKQFMGMVA